MKTSKFLQYISFLCVLVAAPAQGHSPKCRHKLPEIAVQWSVNASEQYVAKADYFKSHIFSMFDTNFIHEHLLPAGTIASRDGKTTMNGNQLSTEIEHTITELRKGVKELTYFTVVKDKEFNWQMFAGLIVLKSKDHPFVVKLFTENPESFLDAKSKGTHHAAMTRLSGGINRYLAGFLRMKNLNLAKEIAAQIELPIPLDFPRKWYWLPSNEQTITVTGRNFDMVHQPAQELKMELPSVYAVVADWIESDMPLAYMRTKYRCTILDICHKFNFEIDPNIKNYKFERGTNKLVLIDTEEFRSLLSLDKKITAGNYVSLHMYVAGHAISRGLASAKPKMRPLPQATVKSVSAPAT